MTRLCVAAVGRFLTSCNVSDGAGWRWSSKTSLVAGRGPAELRNRSAPRLGAAPQRAQHRLADRHLCSRARGGRCASGARRSLGAKGQEHESARRQWHWTWHLRHRLIAPAQRLHRAPLSLEAFAGWLVADALCIPNLEARVSLLALSHACADRRLRGSQVPSTADVSAEVLRTEAGRARCHELIAIGR